MMQILNELREVSPSDGDQLASYLLALFILGINWLTGVVYPMYRCVYFPSIQPGTYSTHDEKLGKVEPAVLIYPKFSPFCCYRLSPVLYLGDLLMLLDATMCVQAFFTCHELQLKLIRND